MGLCASTMLKLRPPPHSQNGKHRESPQTSHTSIHKVYREEPPLLHTFSPYSMARHTKNSDAALDSLMSELDEAQGYKSSRKKRPAASNSNNATRSRPRLLRELCHYPDNSRCVGNDGTLIWNPYVKSDNLPRSSSLLVLPTNPIVEVIRRRAYERFKADVYELLQRLQKKISMKLQVPSLLEKWQMDSKLEELQAAKKRPENADASLLRHISNMAQPLIQSTAEIHRLMFQQQQQGQKQHKQHGEGWIDPILLSKFSSASFPEALKLEVQRCWKDQKKRDHMDFAEFLESSKCQEVMKQAKRGMHRLICNANEFFEQEIVQSLRTATTQKRPKIQRDMEKEQMKVTQYGLSYSVHTTFYEKLQRLFDRAGSRNASFEEAFFCLLCRYDMLQGAGLQAAIPGRVHDVLLKHFDCQMECFASPLNCRYQNFGSAFDLDRLFGSVGSFFTCDFQRGCFQANPPFCEIVIDSMCHRMSELLEASPE